MRFGSTVAALTLVGALVLGACATDRTVETGASTTGPPSTSSTSSTTSASVPPIDCLDIADYAWFGAAEEEAIGKADAEGRPWRIGREDDQTFALTEDHVPDRVTFELDSGTVTFATVELDTGVEHEGAMDPVDIGFMGLTRAEAEAEADDEDIAWRTVRVDDESFSVTADYSEDRRNFEIDGEPPCDFVTAVTRG